MMTSFDQARAAHAQGAQARHALARHALAKINLFLHVTGRRENGYHELDSLAIFAPAADRLCVERTGACGGHATLTLKGVFGNGLTAGEDNLVLRAVHALRATVADPAALPDLTFVLDKRLPVASGIGGGSADAAAALRLAAAAWGLKEDGLAPIAATLGADVPVCLAQRPARMQGIGEILSPAPALPPCAILLVNPGVAVPTPVVFKAWKDSGAPFRPPARLPARWDDLDAMAADLRETENDLQPPAIALFPVIETVIEAIAAQPSCKLARMSGSGATCFGLFSTGDEAKAAARRLGVREWWTDAGALPDDTAF